MGWYGEPESEATKEAYRQRLAEARQKAEDKANQERADIESGAAFRRVTVPFNRGSTGR
jgi:hypothetical protein